jgi:hypothetical protein
MSTLTVLDFTIKTEHTISVKLVVDDDLHTTPLFHFEFLKKVSYLKYAFFSTKENLFA